MGFPSSPPGLLSGQVKRLPPCVARAFPGVEKAIVESVSLGSYHQEVTTGKDHVLLHPDQVAWFKAGSALNVLKKK